MSRIAILLLLLAAMPLRANLGDSVVQCVARYGKPVGFTEANPKCPFGTMFFADQGYALVVFLIGTKEVGARVSKKDKSAFSDSEMKVIMDADSTGAGWTSAPSSDPGCLRWTRGDQATALYDRDRHVLIFTSEDMERTVHMTPNAAVTTPAPASAAPPPPANPGGN